MPTKFWIKKMEHIEKLRVDPMTIIDEPPIYSAKCDVGPKQVGATSYLNRQYQSMIKCMFQSQRKIGTPVVIIVRFFVSPPYDVCLSAKDLKSEKVPASDSYEVCDYLLSFLEMVRCLLVNYRQIVKIDCEKFYSSNPRTVFKFMSWRQYKNGKFSNGDSLQTEAEREREDIKIRRLQSECGGDALDEDADKGSDAKPRKRRAVHRTCSGSSALPDADTKGNKKRKKA